MRLSNRSSRSNAELIELINFVRQYSPCSSHVKVTIADHIPSKPYGNTTKLAEADAMIQVTVYVSKDEIQPHTARLLPETPQVRYRHWKDLFVVTLAHELQHVWQFENLKESGWSTYLRVCASPTFEYLSGFNKDAFLKSTEIDAETFGARVLEQYQRQTK